MTIIDTRVEQLSSNKQKLLALLKKRKGLKNNFAFSMLSQADKDKLPEDIEDAYPLGTVQLGMLYHMLQERETDSPPDYHNVASFRLKLDHLFNLSTFQLSVDQVVQVIPGLRTSFDLTNYSEPLQLVHQSAELPVVYVDWRNLNDSVREQQLLEFIDEENFNLMDINQAPLIRLVVHHLTDDIISLTLTEPHSIADGWSTHLTLIDIFDNYFAMVEERDYQVPKIRSSYSEFIQAERDILSFC